MENTHVVYGAYVTSKQGEFDETQFETVKALLSNKDVIGFDSEGVNLGRYGELSLLQFSVKDEHNNVHVVLIDAYEMHVQYHELVESVLASPHVLKIVHDCRQDSDALFHHTAIKLTNVFDTMIGHQKLHPGARAGLNEALSRQDLPEVPRDGVDYRLNPEFWRTGRRADHTLTEGMIQYASGDVLRLHELYEAQRGNLDVTLLSQLQTDTEFALRMREAEVDDIKPNNMGRFIGRAGVTVRALERDTRTYIYANRNASNRVHVYYHADISDLARVRAAARN